MTFEAKDNGFTPEKPQLEVARHEPIFLGRETYYQLLEQGTQLAAAYVQPNQWVNAILRAEAGRAFAIAISAQVVRNSQPEDLALMNRLVLAADTKKLEGNIYFERRPVIKRMDKDGTLYGHAVIYKKSVSPGNAEGFLTFSVIDPEIPETEVEDTSFVRQALNKIIKPFG